MPPKREKKINPYKAVLITAICVIVLAAVTITAFIIINNNKKCATPQNAIAANNIDTSNISKIFTNGTLSAAVEVSPGKKPLIYFCSQTNGKWKYNSTKTVDLKSGVSEAYLFSDNSTNQMLCVVFSDNKDTASMKLISSDKSEKAPLTFGEANGQKFFAFTFDYASKDKNSYTVVEYDKSSSPIVSSDYAFNDGNFHITCNNTDYDYPVSKSEDVLNSFTYRLSKLTGDFSVFNSEADKDDSFIIKYTSAIHTIIEPSKTKSGDVTYNSVSITMPLEGDDSSIVYINGASSGLICKAEPDTLKENVLKLISGK